MTKPIMWYLKGPAQTELYKHRRWIEARNFVLKKKMDSTICVVKTGADQLPGFGKADLHLCFRICKMLVFS